MNPINRAIQSKIEANLFQGKAIIIVGPRQVGKTTLVRMFEGYKGKKTAWFNADEPDVREAFSNKTSSELKRIFAGNELVIIDEAQRIHNIGLTLKIIIDTIKEVQIIATGSSAFELSDKTKEPLTGRKWEYHLFPISTEELLHHHGEMEEKRMLENRLIFGQYPEVINSPGKEREVLLSISDSVLFKDLVSLEVVKKPYLLEKLLKALALQTGNEVSFAELGQLIDADKETIERYIHYLEQSFILFRLPALSRNVRNELRRSRKIYFYDNGIRNSLISNFNSINLRQDKGALWENFLASERMKWLHYHQVHGSRYFWRTTQQQEIDYIEERDGKFYAFEFKYSPQTKSKFPKTFSDAYPSEFSVVNRDNYFNFLASIPE